MAGMVISRGRPVTITTMTSIRTRAFFTSGATVSVRDRDVTALRPAGEPAALVKLPADDLRTLPVAVTRAVPPGGDAFLRSPSGREPAAM